MRGKNPNYLNFVRKLMHVKIWHDKRANNKNNLIYIFWNLKWVTCLPCRSQWPRVLRRRSAAARLLRLWVRIPPEAGMFIFCKCCTLSGTDLGFKLITRPEESYRLWRVVVCDLETSRMRRPWPSSGRSTTEKGNTFAADSKPVFLDTRDISS